MDIPVHKWRPELSPEETLKLAAEMIGFDSRWRQSFSVFSSIDAC
jgi:hypothetical protein